MAEATADVPSSSLKKSPHDSENNTPALISDNPLDAPSAPRPGDEEDDDGNENEDEDMADAGNQEKKVKEDADQRSSPAPEHSAADGQPAQTKASIEISARSHLIAQTHAIILPSYSTW